MTVVGDSMYVVGGLGAGPNGQDGVDAPYTVERYTPGEGWRILNNMRLQFSAVGSCLAVVNDETLMVIGGIYDKTGSYSSSVR